MPRRAKLRQRPQAPRGNRASSPNPNLNNDQQLLRSIGPNGLFELGIAPAAPGMSSVSGPAPHPGEQLQKQRPADAPGGVEQEPDSEQPNHVRRQSSGFERHDDEHVDEGQRYAADDGRSHPIACPGEEARHDEEEDHPPYAAPERLRENLGNAERRHWLHAERRNRDHASDIEQQKQSLVEGQNGEESGREGNGQACRRQLPASGPDRGTACHFLLLRWYRLPTPLASASLLVSNR